MTHPDQTPRADLEHVVTQTESALRGLIMTIASREHVHHISLCQLSIETLAGWVADISPDATIRYLRTLAQTIEDMSQTGDIRPQTTAENKAALDALNNAVLLMATKPEGSA